MYNFFKYKTFYLTYITNMCCKINNYKIVYKIINCSFTYTNIHIYRAFTLMHTGMTFTITGKKAVLTLNSMLIKSHVCLAIHLYHWITKVSIKLVNIPASSTGSAVPNFFTVSRWRMVEWYHYRKSLVACHHDNSWLRTMYIYSFWT